MERQQLVTMGRQPGNNREMTRKWWGGMMGNGEDGWLGNNEQDGTTTNGQCSTHAYALLPPPSSPLAPQQNAMKAQMPATTFWASGIFLFVHFIFLLPTNCFFIQTTGINVKQAMPMHGMDTQDDDNAATTQDDTALTALWATACRVDCGRCWPMQHEQLPSF
jgi:hypothetical protein